MDGVSHWDQDDTNAAFVVLYILAVVLSGVSIAIMWGAGMHWGHGGDHTYEVDKVFGNYQWSRWYTVLSPYGRGTMWPLIIGCCFILPGSLAILGFFHKTAHELTKAMADPPKAANTTRRY